MSGLAALDEPPPPCRRPAAGWLLRFPRAGSRVGLLAASPPSSDMPGGQLTPTVGPLTSAVHRHLGDRPGRRCVVGSTSPSGTRTVGRSYPYSYQPLPLPLAVGSDLDVVAGCAASRRARGPSPGVHRAGGDSTRDQRGPQGARAPRKGTGRAPARRDPGCAGIAPADLFETVSVEVARLIPAEGAALTRFEHDGTVTALGGWTSTGGYVHAGHRFDLEGTVSDRVLKEGGPARIDDYKTEPGEAAARAGEMGWRSSVGAPITLDGRLWGVLAVASKDEPLPADTERRLVAFTELVATAVANAASGEERARLAAEQAALQRIATLVAEGAPPDEVFAAVAGEVPRALGIPIAVMLPYDADGAATVLAASGVDLAPVGSRRPPMQESLSTTVFETGRTVRVDDWTQLAGPAADAARQHGIRWGIGVPIVVDGALWGVITALSREPQPLANARGASDDLAAVRRRNGDATSRCLRARRPPSTLTGRLGPDFAPRRIRSCPKCPSSRCVQGAG